MFDIQEYRRFIAGRASSQEMHGFKPQSINDMAKHQDDERHVCPLQLDTIQNCLRLYSKPGDVVMDPFNGIGSTGYEAVKSMRRYVGFELKKEYAEQAGANIAAAEAQSMDMFSGV